MPDVAGPDSPRHKHRHPRPPRSNLIRSRPWLVIPIIVVLIGGVALAEGLRGSGTAPQSDHAPRPEAGSPISTGSEAATPTASPSPSPPEIGPAPSPSKSAPKASPTHATSPKPK
ncbi:MAG TPA: hypothetical protein VFW71_02750, partial [Actinomycetota bacterium]|nr:hypothetical protein [Actinomycetota bacterium]